MPHADERPLSAVSPSFVKHVKTGNDHPSRMRTPDERAQGRRRKRGGLQPLVLGRTREGRPNTATSIQSGAATALRTISVLVNRPARSTRIGRFCAKNTRAGGGGSHERRFLILH